MRALVVGGSRFVGYHLVLALHAAGHEVWTLSRGVTPVTFPAGVQRLYADRKEPAQLAAALTGQRFDTTFDVSAYDDGDVRLLLAALGTLGGHYCFVSTTAVYDRADRAPVTEDFPLDRRSTAPPYAAGKVAAEDLLLALHREEGLPVTIVRPSYVYGPHNNLINREFSYFLRLLRGRPILLPEDGLTLLHLGHVDDLAGVFLAAWQRPDAFGQVYNVTGPDAVTVRYYLETIAEIVGVAPRLVSLSGEQMAGLERPVFPFEWRRSVVYDIRKARADLGWEARYDFATGMEQTYRWFREAGLGEGLAYDFSYEDTVLAHLGLS